MTDPSDTPESDRPAPDAPSSDTPASGTPLADGRSDALLPDTSSSDVSLFGAYPSDVSPSDAASGAVSEKGAPLIRRLGKALPNTPGVYRMLDAKGNALYVGKARALQKRVLTYAQPDRLPERLRRMVSATHAMAFIHTQTEVEALLLEANLIKTLQPAYNVLLRDDKSFPYILITGDHELPLMTKHRGARSRKGKYFGPFAAAGAVNTTIATLQKAFMLRNCTDSMFAQRKRPCLQYHIRRCTAPCVGYVTAADYARQVADAEAFLSGDSQQVQDRLAAQMQEASDRMDYEQAARLRDRLRALAAIQAHQVVGAAHVGDADVIALYRDESRTCIQAFFFRGGRSFGNRAYFPRHGADEDLAAIMAAFLAQFYENKPVPDEVIVSHAPADREILTEALATRGGRNFALTLPSRGARRRLVAFAEENAKSALEHESRRLAGERRVLEGVAALCGLDAVPSRIEVYDNSHISGTDMVGAMIVAGPEGLRKNAWRKFNIRSAGEADDYGMMREVLTRRFSRALKEDKGPGSADWPDVVMIDGGQGQFGAAQAVLDELGIGDAVTLLSIAKGPDRNAGREKFFMKDRAPFQMPPDDPVLHYLQRLRDEAHRFAIMTHRARRDRKIEGSPLDAIPGIGAARKKALLLHFGSGQAVSRAAVQDLEQVPGISRAVARKIYEYFHES